MPLGIISTNVAPESIPGDFSLQFATLLEGHFPDLKKLVAVQVKAGQDIVREGRRDPYVYIELFNALGFGTEEDKRALSKAVLDFTLHHLKVTDRSRAFLLFIKPNADDIGVDGGLYSDLQ